jgi:tetratricopeptide (TPR) repeat protein
MRAAVAALAVLAVLAASTSSADLLERGRSALAAGQLDEAIDLLERAAAADPAAAAPRYWLGNAWFKRLRAAGLFGKLPAARRMREAWLAALERDPAHVGARENLVGFYAAAPAIAGGSRGRARHHADALLRYDRRAGRLMRTHVALQADRLDEALRELRRAAAEQPDQAVFPLEQALVHLAREEPAAASAAFAEALARAPRLADGPAALLRRVTAPPPDRSVSLASMHWRLGQVQEDAGQPEAASWSYREALRLDRDFTPAQQALDQLTGASRSEGR